MEQDRTSPLLIHLATGGGDRDYRTIVELIAATTSTAGLTVRCELDENLYPAGIKISDAEMAAINILRHTFHGEWTIQLAQDRKNGVVIYRRFLRSPSP